MNALLHEVESIDHQAVETTEPLVEAIDDMLENKHTPLINTYIVTLYEETLSDGSKTRSVGIRIAEQVRQRKSLLHHREVKESLDADFD